MSLPCLQRHLAYLESQPAEHELMLAGLNMLIKISYVDDTEIFKSCLDYWQLFVADIFGSCTSHTLPGELNS
jgi:exportin-1